MKYFFIFFLWGSVYANTEFKEKFFTYTESIKVKLEELKNIKEDNFSSQIDTYRTELDHYMEQKKHVCKGDFSLVVLDLNDTTTRKRKRRTKLSKEEKKLCLSELKALQVIYINNMFFARKRYLDHLHTKRISELTRLKNEALSSLRESFGRKKK